MSNNIALIVPWIFAFLGICISFYTIKLNSKNAKQLIRVDVLSKNRQEWINTLRDSISQYISNFQTAHILAKQDYDISESIKEILFLNIKIKLLLNPNEKLSKELIENLDELSNSINNNDFQKKGVIPNILNSTQKVLKQEWERVKNIE